MIPDYQQRVIEEHAALQDKCDKLEVFLWSDVFNKLPKDERTRLVMQLGFMRAYRSVLDQRIDAFTS
jgi:hypothetical protein